jgi:acyl-homoserine-lactone acylase
MTIPPRSPRRPWRHAALAACLPLVFGASRPTVNDDPIIRRTEYGVVHIEAASFRAAGIGLGYTQAEDYGERVIRSLLRSKGWMGRTFGKDSMESDFAAMRIHARVQETYHLLDADTRAMYDGFAEGVNRYIRAHQSTLPSWVTPVFHGHDVAAGDIGTASATAARNLVLRWLRRDSTASGDGRDDAAQEQHPDVASRPVLGSDADVGSNAWALAPSRTTSGRAILLRNPHLAWNAGYWEAHVTVPGHLDFYGDFRIGSAFSVVGGFNAHLGWATTNNATDLDEVYELELDPAAPDAYRFDGTSVPVRYDVATVRYRDGDSLATATRRYATTPLGPVVHRTADRVYVVRSGPEGEYRAGAQFLAMMRARSLIEWKRALAMRARATSNLTYADRDGNILTIWMASVPRLPHPSGRDSMPVPARTSADVWTRLITLDSLPQVQNPPGGYVHNENDAPHFANLRALLDTAKFPDNVERGELRLRSQHALQLIANSRKFSLEDVVRRKHSMRMLLADRVKADLLAAVIASPLAADSTMQRAVTVLRAWDNTVAPDSRGGVLFESWWRRYQQQARDTAFAVKWSWQEMTTAPRGLGQPDKAVKALEWAVQETSKKFGALDVAWGDVHRVRRGSVDVPVGGCSGALGCFRVLTYEEQPDGKRAANSGDGWVLAVEFGRTAPRAYSILAYGQSTDPASPHHADQAAMFARGEFKPVRFTAKDVAAHTIRTYTPAP